MCTVQRVPSLATDLGPDLGEPVPSGLVIALVAELRHDTGGRFGRAALRAEGGFRHSRRRTQGTGTITRKWSPS